MKKIFFITLFLISCKSTRIIFSGAQTSFEFSNGYIILEKSMKGIYIPNDLSLKDIVNLKYSRDKDSFFIESEFKKTNVNIFSYQIGSNKDLDSISVSLSGHSNIPFGFVSIAFFNDSSRISTFSPLNRDKKAFVAGASRFCVNVLGAKSDTIRFNSQKNMGDSLILTIKYLEPHEIERYTFIETKIPIKKPAAK